MFYPSNFIRSRHLRSAAKRTRPHVPGTQMHLSVCLSICLSVCLSVCLSACLCACPSPVLPTTPHLVPGGTSTVYLSVCPSVCLSVCLPVPHPSCRRRHTWCRAARRPSGPLAPAAARADSASQRPGTAPAHGRTDTIQNMFFCPGTTCRTLRRVVHALGISRSG
jgi:hypothetical protein